MQTSLSRAASSFEFPSVERATISTGLSDKQIDKYLQSPPAEKLAAQSSGSLKQRISFFFFLRSTLTQNATKALVTNTVPLRAQKGSILL